MISFFAKPPFWMRHLQRVSSVIRGEQIAAYMGNARLNPPSGYENDVCIYVKPHIKKTEEYKFEKRSYLDIQDGFELRHILNKYPKVTCIAFSDYDVKTLKKYIKNKIVVIPHHHLNFERIKRDRDKITTVGMTGSIGAFEYVPEVIRKGLAKRKIGLVEWSTFYPRMYVSKFHHGIDIHLQWRPYPKSLSCPLKITNAASFGIPTIALTTDEPSFKEVEGCYIGVSSPEEWLEKLDNFINSPKLYKDMAENCLKTAEKYHIDNISKLYRKLK